MSENTKSTMGDAADVLAALCPMGDAIDGITVDQGWDDESTRISFADGSALTVSGSDVAIADSELSAVKVGDRVCAGAGEDYDTGEVDSITDDMAVVRWDSGVVTPCPVADLEVM